ncbi:hypothetical protein [Streptomyces pseudogriseolus]|uniref:Uncharacterized protein n=1 Tax=Streptomyces pseudogriseolus TaxID=36817 RepID=A0ABQ2T0D5_STREZ|nr:hypothetical protein [Streptomyces rubiginosus]GGS46199.1 hypothetical protein GCM10010285_27290 [Streptomyces rubiginosus]
MGLTYGYDIHLRPENVARALTEVAKLAPPGREAPPLPVTLPDGERVVLPFTASFESEPVDCSSLDSFELDTSIMFPADEAVRAYAEDFGHHVVDGRVPIGYVYLTVRFQSFLDPHYACLEFWAATSRMSRLFEASPAVRKVFTDLAAASGAVCCLFDTGDGSPERVLWLDEEAAGDLADNPRFPDPDALMRAGSEDQ